MVAIFYRSFAGLPVIQFFLEYLKVSMFIFLSKLLPLFAYPLGLACLLLVLALAFHRNARVRWGLTLTAVLILWLSSTTGLSNLLARSLEYRYQPPDEIPAAEVAVVLGGGTDPAVPPRSSVEINSAGDRVLYAAELYRQGLARRLLLTGGEISWQTGGFSSPAEDMAAILTTIGVPQEALWLETESLNTYENALFCAEMLAESGIQTILLVTSAMHMPRAVALFEAQGLEVIPLPVDYSVTDEVLGEGDTNTALGKVLDIIPNASNLTLTTAALKEYFGMLVYQLRGWL
jgi:uncharacterized SAM-binding protein YcdF (DUF218 family)